MNADSILNLLAHPSFDCLIACPGGWRISYSSKTNQFAPGTLFDGTLDKLLSKYQDVVLLIEAEKGSEGA